MGLYFYLFTSYLENLLTTARHYSDSLIGRRYNFFVSYSTNNYSADAFTVTTLLQERGHRIWLDQERISGRLVSQELLMSVLAQAVQSSDYLLFFDLRGWLLGRAQLVTGGVEEVPLMGSLSTFWQQFERQYGNRIIDIVPPQGTIEFGCPIYNIQIGEAQHEATFSNYIEAVAIIANVVRSP